MTKKLLLVLMILLVAKNYTGAAKPKAESDSQSRLQIELRRFGYQKPKPAYPSDKTVSSNPRLLMEDLRSRLSFVGDNSLVVYFSRPLDKPVDTRKSEGTANTMEAFFLNVDAWYVDRTKDLEHS